ncbi:MAG: MFS transporter [Erythrobacter sp.]|uniref:MFS transporter n=1 Tax=Erythrobacter sp. TaxID=1042 RepID=UPI002631ED2E|nr:MFS transporter [Erythrobacter sp.]MDJ0979770.1 MFS transporter [Erythrobacter sp.]
MTTQNSKLPLRLKFIHGFGAVAFGVKEISLTAFLLIYYNQVLGMDASLVSLALLVALLIDAVVDPIIGNLTDRTYTRWGQRLPWLYTAPIPLALAWLVLWSPPAEGVPQFWNLVAVAATVRILLSACEVPSTSLVPELTTDYDERTTLFRFRYILGWMGGVITLTMAYTVFLAGENGVLNRDGYFGFALFGGVLMVVSVMGSAMGQHKLVAKLPKQRPAPFSVISSFKEIFEAFSEKAFLIFATGGLAAYISQGLTFSLNNYLILFVWRLDTAPIPFLPEGITGLSIYPLALALSAILMFLVVGPLHARFGKPGSAALCAVGTTIMTIIPYALFMAGLWPELDTSQSALTLLGLLIVGNTMGIVVLISATSMVAEIVEAYLERTGRRAEGAFYSGNWLVQKCATGLGIFLSGQLLSVIDFPDGADPNLVPQPIITDLMIYYLAATVALMLFAGFWLGRFPITREEHQERLQRLAAKPVRSAT